MALGESLTAISKVSPSSLFSGSGPDGPGRLGSPAYNIPALSHQLGVGPQIERAFLAAKSKFLPKWLRMSFPLDNEKKPLASIIKPTENSVDAYENNSVVWLGESIDVNGAVIAPTKPKTNVKESNIPKGKSRDVNGKVIAPTPHGAIFGRPGAVGNIQSLAGGFPRPSKYIVSIFPNTNIPNWEYVEEAEFSCSSATLPGKSLSTFDDRRGSPNLNKKPYDVIYEDLKLTFQISEDMKERILFENWLEYINAIDSGVFAYPMDYYTDISITQLNNDLSVLKTIHVKDAFPTNISEVALGYDMTNVIETFDVNFTYKTWK